MRLPADLLTSLKSSLDAFLASEAKFKVLKSASKELPHQVNTVSTAGAVLKPRKLLILDSSFNPPSRAHSSLVTSALTDCFEGSSSASHAVTESNANKQIGLPLPEYRILYLFSVHNADKSPSPAAFPHRISLMYASALDLLDSLSSLPAQSHQSALSVDVAVTTEPFYSDKSAAIDASGAYAETAYERPAHVHLIGYDTFVRFLDPKYYSSYTPPLSALDEFFKIHGLRLTLRASSTEEAQEQRGMWEKLASGGFEKDGGRREWANSIDVIEGDSSITGVSSTAIRQACEEADWRTVEDLCPPLVAKWVRENALYQQDATVKM